MPAPRWPSPRPGPTWCARRTEADLEATAERVRRPGGGRSSSRPTCSSATSSSTSWRPVEEFGRIDILVNNAGGWPPRPALRTSADGFEQALRFNVAPFLLTRLVVPVMVETAGGGAVVNISSAASMVQPGVHRVRRRQGRVEHGHPQHGPDLAPKVRINAIEVGGVETDALASVLTDDSVRRQLEENTPMRRVGQVEDIAAGVVYLASDASSWVTGKIIEIDGGVEHPAFTIPVEPL